MSGINNTEVGIAKDLDVVMPMHSLLEYTCQICYMSKTGCL